MKAATLLLAALAVLAGAAAFAAPPLDAELGESTTVTVVEVPVHVVQGGEPVAGLTAADFELYDDGRRQEITAFEAIDLYAAEAATGPDTAVATSPPVAARRHFLFLFDRAFSAPESLERARRAAGEILAQLHPSDLAAVAEFGAARGTVFVLGFTSDRRQVEIAIASIGAPQLVDRHPDPLRLFLGDLLEGSLAGPAAASVDRAGIDSEAEYREQMKQMLESADEMEKLDQRGRITAFQRGLQDLAGTIGAIAGRKHVVLLSEGYDDRALVGTGTEDVETRAARESGEIWKVDTEDTFGQTRLQNELGATVAALQRSGAVIQAVDVGRLRSGAGVGTQGLFALARETGGELYESFNDLGAAMGQMLRRTGVTYLLAFQPDRLAADGKPHRLKVAVKDAPRGTRVVHRPAYFAPRPWSEVDGVERRLTAAELVLDRADSGSIDLAALAAPQPAAGPRGYVPVLVEVGGTTLLAGHRQPEVAVELFAYAFDPAGGVADHYAQVIGLDLGRTGEALRETGLKHWGHFDLAPGRYALRLVVRNAATGEHGARTLDLVVPDFANGDAVLLSPLVPEPPGRWVMTREGADRQRDVPYPFLVAGEPFVPAALPTLPSRGATPIVLQGFHLRGEFQTWVHGEDGALAAATVTVDDLEATPGTQLARATLETAGLAPGRYRLEVEAGGEVAGLAFVVE